MPSKKKPTARKPRPKPTPPVAKSYDYSSVWTPIGGYSGLSSTYDNYGSQAVPGPSELIGAFTDVVYSCSTLIASSLAEIDIQLVAETRAGQVAPADAPKMWRRSRHRSKAVELHELHDHPVLDLLYKPNPTLTYADIITATSLYLDILGRAFWLITDTTLGQPGRIDVLPAHLVSTQRDDAGRITGYWLGQCGSKDDEPTYKPDQVLAFRHHEYFDPQQEGVSPVRAVWQKLQLSSAELSSWEVITKQMATPLVLLSPKDANVPMSGENAERFLKEFWSRHSRGGQGGPFFNNEAVDVNFLTPPPKDTTGLLLQDNLKTSICNAFKVPRTLLDMQDANFAASKSSERAYQLFCLKPRIDYIISRITSRIVSRFDDRLFLEPADFVEKDEALELQRQTTAITAYTAGLLQMNECRAVFDAPPVPDGDKFYTAPAPSFGGMSLAAPATPDAITAVESKASTPEDSIYDKYSIRPVAEIMQRWFAKQKDYFLTRAASKAWASKSWIDLSQFTPDMAAELRPALQVFYDGAGKTLAHRLGLTDEVWNETQPKLAEAVEKAALALADSTNSTTALAVDEARERLRQELTDGLTTGDTVQELTKRVKAIFENATDERAWLVADTERTRAIGAGELITARESGVVKSKVWLADSRACDRCSALNGVARAVDEPFAVSSKGGPYSVCQHPPFHPGCRCSMTYDVTDG